MLKKIFLLYAYVSIEQWNVGNMKMPYDIKILVFIQMIYQKDKVCYFNNKNAISMMKINRGEMVNQAEIMFKTLFKKLGILTKAQAKMIERKGKLDAKKDMCNFKLVIEILMQHLFPNKQYEGPITTTTSQTQKSFIVKPQSAKMLKDIL